jgi:hypothetical protein
MHKVLTLDSHSFSSWSTTYSYYIMASCRLLWHWTMQVKESLIIFSGKLFSVSVSLFESEQVSVSLSLIFSSRTLSCRIIHINTMSRLTICNMLCHMDKLQRHVNIKKLFICHRHITRSYHMSISNNMLCVLNHL